MAFKPFGPTSTSDVVDTTRKKRLNKVLDDLEQKIEDNGSGGDVSLESLGGVPETRKINNKPLNEDINLTAGDIGAATNNHEHSVVSADNDGYMSSEMFVKVSEAIEGGLGTGLSIGNVSGISLFPSPGKMHIKWTDPEDIVLEDNVLAAWGGTKVVRKVGSFPTSANDGVLVFDNKSRNAYQSTAFVDTGLTNGTEYFYQFFPYTDKGMVTNNTVNQKKATPVAVPPGDVTNITAANAGNGKISVKWTDPDATIVNNGITMSTWAGTKVVYKTGSYPANENDGTVAKNSTTRNAYSSTALEINGLTNGTQYYIAIFPYNADGAVNTNAVNRATVTPDRFTIANVPTQNGTITYDGNSKVPQWNNYDSSKMTIGGTTTGTNAGDYSATFTPGTDYKWSDGTTAAKTVSWSIGKATIANVPSQSGTITYDGNSKTPSWSNYDSAKMTLGGTTSGMNAGSYNATFTPGTNYKWSDDTTAAKTVAWTISKASYTLSISPTALTLNTSTLTSNISVTRSGDGVVSATSSDTSVATVSVNGTTVTVSHVNQKSGTATITVKVAAGTNHTAPADKTCAVTASFIPTVLNDATWAQIKSVSDAGTGSSYWNVGDRKAVTLGSGTVGEGSIAGTYYCFILGFNHNSAKEGTNRIHFQFGKTALTGGTDISFTDSKYGNTGSDAAFRMNTSNTNSGGWNGSYMRNTICPAFKNVLPSDLQNVLKTVTKYSDNTGGGSDTASYVTATTDTIFLLAEWEVHGARTYANSAEQSNQLQYDYYKTGNSKVKYRSKDTASTAFWWLRSVRSSNTTYFCRVSTDGSATGNGANNSRGFAPGFAV